MILKTCIPSREFSRIYLICCFFGLIIFSGCNSDNNTSDFIDKDGEVVQVEEILIIGLEEQGEDYLLANPISVRTDSENNIYVADKSLKTIKVFDDQGHFIKNIGSRGRGPGEFLNIHTFEITPEENFFVVDRWHWRYKFISKEGTEISRIPFDRSGMEWIFTPSDIDFYEDKVIALYHDAAINPEKSIIERELFYIYDHELKNRIGSFFKFSDLQGIETNTAAFVNFTEKPGSFVLSRDKRNLYYSPIIYHGNIYCFLRENANEWKLHKVIKAGDFSQEGYTEIDNSLYEKYRSKSVPGYNEIMFGGAPDPYAGRVNTFDAGIHQLSDGRIIVFTAIWRDPMDKEGEHENIVDVYAQVINKDDSIERIGLVTSLEASRIPWQPLINWKDADDNFYLLTNTNLSHPTVTKFRLEL